jgi:hypothetical protein
MPRNEHTPEEKAFFKRLIEETREACKNVVIVTPHQHPRPPGYKAYVPPNPNGIVIVDYITLLP